jgi:hypothetical protein
MNPPPPPRRVVEGVMYASVSVCMDACVVYEAIATIIIIIYYYYYSFDSVFLKKIVCTPACM